jgi:hypothetical protein
LIREHRDQVHASHEQIAHDATWLTHHASRSAQHAHNPALHISVIVVQIRNIRDKAVASVGHEAPKG